MQGGQGVIWQKNTMDGLANEKRLTLKTDIDPDLPETITGDSGRLRQILLNLIGNAIKITEQGKVCVLFQKMESEWSIVVRNTGIGIPTEQLPDIFEPFRRGSDYATRRHQGADLGLSIVKTLVTVMGGRVEVESAIGKGSVFTITLSLKEENKE